MAKSSRDPLAALANEDPRASQMPGMGEDPTEQLNQLSQADISLQKEVESLRQTVARMSNEQEALKTANLALKAGKHWNPTEDEANMKEVWDIAYRASLMSIFNKGLTYYNSKAAVLRNELQLAVVRADEALENYIIIRKTFMNPATKAIQDASKL